MKCVQCGLSDIVENVKVFDEGHGASYSSLMVGFELRPNSFWNSDIRFVRTFCNVCVDCGFVMLAVSASDATKLKGISEAEQN